MATPEEILAKFGSATRAEAEKGINNPHSDGGKKNADADAAEPVADAIHPDEEKENRTAQLQERNDPLTGETKKFLTKFLQLNNIQLSIIEGDGVLNSFFTRLGLADFTDKDTLIRGLRVLKPRYHPDRNGGGDDEKIKILNGASSWIKKSYEEYRPDVTTQKESPEELSRREKAVHNAKTFDDLFDVVSSFGTVYSESFQRDVPVEEWIRRMERDRQDASSFNTRSEFFYSGWSATVTRTHGIREKFVALVSQMIDENERVFMERKTTGEKEREILVNSAKTPEELCDIVASFETIHSQTLGNTPGKKWAEGMREELASALLYEDEDDLQMYWYSTATRTYGIREKFEALVLEKVRYEKSKQKARKDAKQRIKTPNSSAEDPPLKQRRASNRSKKSADKEPVVPPVAPVNATELQKEKTQPTKEELAGVKDFDELFAVLDKYDGIQGSGEFYTSERLRDIISNVRKGDRSLDPITNSKGLRGVVKRLLQEEREPYVSGEVFNQEILAEQDARSEKKTHDPGKENIMTPGSPDAVVTTDLSKEKEMAEQMGGGVKLMAEMAEAGRLKKEKQEWDSKIKALEGELDDLRAKYAKKDYEETGVWKRLSGIFGKSFKDDKALEERKKYQEKLRELIDLRLTFLKESGKEGDELKTAMAEELQYFGMESKTKLYDAWTNAQMEKKGFSEKILELGRQYNKLSLWKKAAIGATVLGVGAGVAAGGLFGAAGGTIAASLVGLRRGAVAGGLFATFEAGLEKLSQKSAENDVKYRSQLHSETIMEQHQSPEERMAMLQGLLVGEINDNSGLEDRVKGRDRRRAVAFGGALAATFGLVEAWHYFHGAENVNATDVKDAAKGTASVARVAADSGAPAPGVASPSSVKDFVPNPSHLDARDLQGADNYKEALVALEAKSKLIDTFVNQDITVVKGDSVWKISGRLADQMKLTGGARTHFIDAIKDKFGDVQLQEGKTINLSAKGIDREFIEKALGKSGSLTAEQIHSIEANDAKIAEFARANPGVTLTNEGVDQILHSNPSGGVSLTDVNGSRAQYIPSGGAPSGIDSAATAPAEVAPSSSVKDIISQASEKLSAPQQARLNDWYMQIFRTENSTGGKDWVFDKKSILKTKLTDIVRVSDGKMIFAPGFDAQQVKNFKEFSDALPKEFPKGQATLAEFVKAKPDITVNEYLARVAQNVKPGTRIGLYTTTN